jgi:hypothetical protein
MKMDSKSWLIAAGCLAIVLMGGAQAWKTLQTTVPAPAPAAPDPAPVTPSPASGAATREEPTAVPMKAKKTLKAVEQADPAPEPPPPASPAKTGVDAIKTKDRLITVTARCDAAEEAYRKIRNDSAQLGQTPHPSITESWSRMRLALDEARRELDRGEIAEARSSLDVAEASAGKVIRAGGGN